MPIPTDTFWNIKKLNAVFAISTVLLMLITVWTILQDYGGTWRIQQRSGRVWEAALTQDKIKRDLAPDKQAALKSLEADLARAEKEVDAKHQRIDQLKNQIQQMESQRATMEFRLNTDKANVGVEQAHLQDAIAASDEHEISSLKKKLAPMEQSLNEQTEALQHKKDDIVRAKDELKSETAKVDALTKRKNQLTGDVEALRKKYNALEPQSLFAKVSSEIRSAPLMGFINPAEKLQQVVLPDVLTDVAFMKITTVDRCTTCHVNIAKKDFSEVNLLAYLEEQAATAKGLRLPEAWSGVPTDPTATAARPGAAAMIDFWHAWARKMQPDVVKRSAGRLRAVATTVGKTAKVTFDGKALASFAYDPNLDDPRAKPSTQPSTQPTLGADGQSQVLVALLDAWLKYELPAKQGQTVTSTSDDGRVKIEISYVPDATAKPLRNAAMRYPEELRTALKTALPPEQSKLLNDRYRFAMTALVNPARKRQGYAALDPSPALLAHPRLDLYCDPDSKHPIETAEGKIGMGCTSCHDGSGQETDFVLAAHTPREIWVDSKTGEPVLNSQLTKDPESESQEFKLDSLLAAVYPENSILPTLSSLHFSESAKPEQHGEHAEPTSIDYIDPVTGSRAKAVPQFTYWRKTYEPTAPRSFHLVYDEWDWPMRTPAYIEANCVRCHSDVYDIKHEAPVVYEGRYLFANLGCVNCHQMDSVPAEQNRKVGTDLRHVTAKLSPAFINSWAWAPKAFRPSTKMPHFFMLENNSSDEEIRRTRQEVRAITEYLVRTSQPLPLQFEVPANAKGSPDAGQKIFNTIGCKGCHVNLNDPVEKRGGKTVTLGEQWILTDLTKSGKATADEAKKLYDQMTYNERQLYVLENLEQLPGATDRPAYPDGSPKPIFMHHGPELSGIGTKLTAGRTPEEARAWLFNWVKDPRHYSDYTLMPRLRLSDQQALDLSEYLLSMKRTNDKSDDPWTADLAAVDSDKCIELCAHQLKSRYTWRDALKAADDDAVLTKEAIDALTTPVFPVDKAKDAVQSLSKDQKRLVFLGKKMVAHYGCMSCHMINGMENATNPGTNLSDWGQKQVSKLDYGYLSEHQHMIRELPETTQVSMVNGLSAEAVKLAHGEIDWSQSIAKPVTVAWPVIEARRQDWIEQKLKNTRIYDRGKALLEPVRGGVQNGKPVLEDPGKPYDKLKMPTFYLNDEQVHAIATFVLSNRDRLISEKLWLKADNPQAKQIARGRELVTRYACVNCHQIEQNVPQVQQYYKQDELTVLAPPSLRGEGNKIQHNWLFNFFKNVVQMRPRIFDGIRMPSFPASDDEFAAIIAYFNSASKKESQDLKSMLAPVQKYIEDAKKAAAGAGKTADAKPQATTVASAATKATTKPLAPTDVWPGDDWWSQPTLAASAEYLRNWALTNKQITELQLDPTKNKAEELGKNFRLVLFKAQFVQQLFDAPYPFVDSPRPEMSKEEFTRGAQFFYSLQCLKCHVLGDPNVAGANKTPTAPNLSLASVRLQRRWVRHWVQEPGVIQIGTAMPPFFTGQPIYDLHGQPWPKSQNEPDKSVKLAEKMFGSTVEQQTDLLLDFLYAAGASGYTGTQPAKTPFEEVLASMSPPAAPAPATKATSKATAGASTPPASASPAKNSPAKPAIPGAATAPAAR